MRPIAAAVPVRGTPRRPSSSPIAPAVLRVPIGKVSHDSGTPALAIPGRICFQWTRAATTYAVDTEDSDDVGNALVGDTDGLLDRFGSVEHARHVVSDVAREMDQPPRMFGLYLAPAAARTTHVSSGGWWAMWRSLPCSDIRSRAGPPRCAGRGRSASDRARSSSLPEVPAR